MPAVGEAGGCVICAVCGDKGIIAVPWMDAPDDYAVCLCTTGRGLRVTTNCRAACAALWQVWAAREQIDPLRVFMLEDILTPEELTARGFGPPSVGTPVESRAAALLSASRARKGRL